MVRLNKKLDPTQTGQDAEKLYTDLHKRIIGQNEAIDHIVNIYQMYLAGMNGPARPIGNFLFLGPTGSGKTRLVEATAESLVGDARAMIKIDCAEFQHSHEIAKLIGSPPGYLGHRETHPLLSQEVLNQFQTEKMKLSFVLFDEIEKASDALWNLLLGILDKATLTLGDNRRVDFSRTLIFMTSNLGAAEMGSILRPNLGFAASEIEKLHETGQMDIGTTDKIARAGVEAARRKFTPEFMNRIDKVVVFKPLGEAELRKILGLELNILQQRIFNSSTTTPFVFTLSEPAKDHLLAEGTDMKYGARHLKRAIDRALVQPISNLIATQQVRGGDLIKVDFDSEAHNLTFAKEAEDMPAYAMVQMMEASANPPVSPLTTTASVPLPRMAARGRRTLAG
ncbi:MAG: ATP-dependent Clp protease ATP-binding subunit [Acidobacteria bacterium]|nr:MAG: ATP-dependent Clp protease ATP-binding subunit [Acidobacteriota bacterium]